MVIQGAQTGVTCNGGPRAACGGRSGCCPDKFGCPPGRMPDFVIRRHDTRPPIRVQVEDCDGPLNLSEETLVAEVNMWANAKLKAKISSTDTYFRLADDIGFEQAMVGDVIVMDRIRNPEHMLVIGFDETNKFIQVERGYNLTTPSDWPKGQKLRIFKIMNGQASIETELDDIIGVDGVVQEDQLSGTFLVYEWQPKNTCTPGCFWLEFKLLKMIEVTEGGGPSITPLSMMNYNGWDVMALNVSGSASVTPSFTPSSTPEDFGCFLGDGVEWVRRFPVCGEGFLIKIEFSPTTEI